MPAYGRHKDLQQISIANPTQWFKVVCSAGAGTVSSKPIVLRVEFAYAPNLTIIDTPGFILKVTKQICARNLPVSSCQNIIYNVDQNALLKVWGCETRRDRERETPHPMTSWTWSRLKLLLPTGMSLSMCNVAVLHVIEMCLC